MDTAILRAPRTHPPVFQDGLGARYHVPGPGGETLEVLALHEPLTAAPSFEFSLRERVGALAAFEHPAFMHIRGVQRLGQAGVPNARTMRVGVEAGVPNARTMRVGVEAGVEETAALAVVSDCPAGARLSEVLAVAEQQLLPLDINAALHLIRQLVDAVATLHEQMHGISHGALTPERLVVSPQGRLLVVDHALGAALEHLHFSHERYWKDLRIPLPNPAGTPRFDQRADILQVGAVALALIVGRPLYGEEFPDRIGPLAERAWGLTAAGGVEPLPAAVRTWLARALQLDARQSFASAVAARAELERAVGVDQGAALAAVRAFLAQYAKHAASARAQADPPQKPATAAGRPVPAAVPAAVPPPVAAPVAAVVSPPAAMPAPRPDPRRQTASDVKTVRTDWWRRRATAAVVVLGVRASASTFAGRWYLTPPAAAEAAGTLIIESNPAGAAAMVDGEPRGFTPLTLTLTPGAHVLEVVNEAERRTIPVTIAAGNTVSQFLDLPVAVAPTAGQLRVRTEPAGARVTVDGVARGQAPLTMEGLEPGTHTVVLANDLTSVTHEVVIEAGADASLVVPMTAPQGVPVSGWISVAAPVDVQIYERERLLGSNRSDRIMMAVGRHELALVNEALGYAVTRLVTVAPGQVSAVTLEWPNGSMALNAQPWAEVWIDGERVGETPIGNLGVPIGPHEVVFRHPELGEQVVRTTVTLKTPARVSVDLRRR